MSKKSALKKNFLTVILLALAGSIIYGLPYYRFYYYDSYMQLYLAPINVVANEKAPKYAGFGALNSV